MKRKRISKWIDGDSGVFSDGTRFRLARVGCPERGQYGASKATRMVAGMTSRTKGVVSVKKVGQSYGRDVVEIWNRHGSVNDRMRHRGCIRKGK